MKAPETFEARQKKRDCNRGNGYHSDQGNVSTKEVFLIKEPHCCWMNVVEFENFLDVGVQM